VGPAMPDDDVRTRTAVLVADLYEAAGVMRRRGDRIASVAGQSQARWQLLSVVSEGTWTVPHAARRLGLTRQAVQRVADDLRAAGLVRTERNPNHQRSPLIVLTDAGREALAAITHEAVSWDARVFADLDAADLAAAQRVLRAIIAADDRS
jgi:DNA-binding MarR family transcriptional regulator